MEMPSAVHPKRININGYIFEVVSYTPLTDEQAAKVARLHYSAHKFKKKDRGTKVFRVVTLFDEDSSRLL